MSSSPSMHYEYAVEPAALGESWQTFRYIMEKFGFDRGRLISEFPRKWLREVYGATGGFSDLQRKRVEEILKGAKTDKLIRAGRTYDENAGDWLDNALREHQREPFRAIVARAEVEGKEVVLCADNLNEAHALVEVPNNRAVKRTATAISEALTTLLRHGEQILFIDPFFDVFSPRYQKTLRACLRITKAHNAKALVEVHYRFHPDGSAPKHIEANIAAFIAARVIPDGMSLKVHCWEQIDGGADFHARYVLTERGGVCVEAGLSAQGGAQTTDMYILDRSLCAERRAAFALGTKDYTLIGPVLQIHADGTVVRL